MESIADGIPCPRCGKIDTEKYSPERMICNDCGNVWKTKREVPEKPRPSMSEQGKTQEAYKCKECGEQVCGCSTRENGYFRPGESEIAYLEQPPTGPRPMPPMSEHGKNNAHEEMEICTDCCMRQSKKDSINLERYSQKIEELRGFLTTAETAATEYAQQAAELQERNEELQGKLNHNCPYCPSWQEENTVLIHQIVDLQEEMERLKRQLETCQALAGERVVRCNTVTATGDMDSPSPYDLSISRKARGE